MEVIATENLTKYYGKLKALDELNLTVEKGDCVGLLGPNGAGKTTTIKILTGLLKPTSGKAYIRGIDVTKNPERALIGVGALIETPELYGEFTPREILSYLGKLRGMNGSELSEAIENSLRLVKMLEWIDTPISKFSRGMKQRVAIAQAILHDPEIIILDEPSLGLDPRGMAEIREVIIELNRNGKTILVASHLLYEVQQMCNKVALINRGKLVLYDNIDALDKMLKGLTLRVKLLEKVNEGVISRIMELEGVENVSVNNKSELLIVFKGKEESLPDLVKSLIVDLELKVIEFKRHELPIESIYLELVKEVS